MWRYGTQASGLFGYTWWALHMIAVVLFSLGFVALVLWAARSFDRVRRGEIRAGGAGILSALTILQERYARGDIGREEYLQKRQDMGIAPFREDPAAQT